MGRGAVKACIDSSEADEIVNVYSYDGPQPYKVIMILLSKRAGTGQD